MTIKLDAMALNLCSRSNIHHLISDFPEISGSCVNTWTVSTVIGCVPCELLK